MKDNEIEGIVEFAEPALVLVFYLSLHCALYAYFMIGKEPTFINYMVNGLIANILSVLAIAFIRPAYWFLKCLRLTLVKFYKDSVKLNERNN